MQIVQTRKNSIARKADSGAEVFELSYFFDGTKDIVSTKDSAHRLIDFFRLDDLLAELGIDPASGPFCSEDYAFERTGWQSWDAGWELQSDEKAPEYISFLIPQLKNYIQMPNTVRSPESQVGQFIVYLRWGNNYLVLASTGRLSGEVLPPVQFRLNRKERTLAVEIYADGHQWQQDEHMATITCFVARGFFQLKDTIRELYRTDRFERLNFLGDRPAGWESWYNHYNVIDEKLIFEDLAALGATDNLLKLEYLDKKKPLVFQIDDGWQEGTGQWEIRSERFPQGLKAVTEKIAEKGYIPGLWLAPFIFDMRTDFIRQHKDWILRDKKGRPVVAGFNPAWGAPCGKFQPGPAHSYFVLDLSRDDVIDHLDFIIGRAINEWGFRYLKLDFLFAGMLDGVFAKGGSAYQWYDRAVKVLTKRNCNDKGEPVAYLGCGMPFETSFMNFPLSRIGTDTLEHWDRADLKMLRFCGRPSAHLSMRDTLGHAFWNKAVYLNDPDVVFLRSSNCTLSDTEKELLAMVNFLFGSQIMHSDDPSAFDPEKEGALTKRIVNLYTEFADEEFGNIAAESDVYYIFSRSKSFAGVINLSDKEAEVDSKALFEAADLETKFSPEHCRTAAGTGKVQTSGTDFSLLVPPRSYLILALQ
ncbi:MAG: alpha-galactosidase [Treponemataceae bacterium]|nr:alpha-galactosidase [Treponemataceae bacterium]